MFFRVQNLGPLREAEVDLSKDLIVLAGPNNSGKTYLAWSVYGLHRVRNAQEIDLSHWVRQILDSPDGTLAIGDIFAKDGAQFLEAVVNNYKSSLHLCFAAATGSFADADIVLRNVTIAPGSTVLRGARKTYKPHEMPIINDFILLRLFETVFAPCTLFPAERIAINIFAKELALKRTALVDEMVEAELDDQIAAPLELIRRNAGRYPWPIRDSLKTANDLANLSNRKSDFAYLADELETAVLGGAVAVSDAGEMLFSPRGTNDARLQMHLTASVVKSLSSLVFYFRHLAKHGDFIIIDEPELNLHPDNQRKITRILAKAARLGFKVMMSTHSDYVLRELNHMIMLSRLPEEEAKSLGYDPMSAIKPDRIGVYLFNENHSEPVPITETGFSIKTIDDVVNQLNADEQRLYARLSE